MTGRLRLLAGGWVSIQDGGRAGHARHGVGSGGPMDPLSHLLAARLAGVPPTAVRRTTTIEVGPDGATIAVERGPVALAVAGPGATVSIADDVVAAPVVVEVRPGRTLTIAGTARWTVLCPVGALEVPAVLGSTSRHGRADLGPVFGVGDVLEVRRPRRGGIPLGARPQPARPGGPLLLLPGPQTHMFTDDQRAALAAGPLVVSPAGDRMAVRLDGVRIPAPGGHDIVSDAIVPGAVQVQGDGAPWVLLAEHQPTGGYPKVGVLAAADRCRLAQAPIGAPVPLRWGSVDAARTRWASAVAAVERCVATRPTPTPDVLRRASLAGSVDADTGTRSPLRAMFSGLRVFDPPFDGRVP